MQATHQDDVVRACQQRDPHACEQLVRSQQEMALRTAYLLTGDTAAAVRLASDAFLALVPGLFHVEPDWDVRSWLLQIIAGRYLAGQPAIIGAGSAPATDTGTQRFAVDDERSRTLAALGRLDRQTRTLLVLHDFGRLDEASLAALLGLSGTISPRLHSAFVAGEHESLPRVYRGVRPYEPYQTSIALVGVLLLSDQNKRDANPVTG